MKKITGELSKAWQISFMAMLCAVIVMVPSLAFAASPVGASLCAIGIFFTGQVASGIATIGICVLGAMACLGRVQWITAVIVATGVAVLFGASGIVSMFGPTC